MMGSWTVQVEEVRPFSIHGDRYFELRVWRVGAGSETQSVVRIPEHVSSGPPIVGERYSMTFLMGQVTALKRTGSAAG